MTEMVRALLPQFPAEQAIELAVDNAATFYLAGHETTANAISWVLFLLSEQPGLQDELAAEARTALAGGRDAELPNRLPKLRMMVEETLRLYPPAPRFDREAIASDRLGEHPVGPGDLVSIWPWLLHRHRTLWVRPDAFDPARFAPERRAERHRFQFLPFGAGPRMCVGARLAMAEALTMLAAGLESWRFPPVPGRVVRASGSVTLRPAGGMPLILQRLS